MTHWRVGNGPNPNPGHPRGPAAARRQRQGSISTGPLPGWLIVPCPGAQSVAEMFSMAALECLASSAPLLEALRAGLFTPNVAPVCARPGLDYVTPADRLAGRNDAIAAARNARVEAARDRRAAWRQGPRAQAPQTPSSPAPLACSA